LLDLVKLNASNSILIHSNWIVPATKKNHTVTANVISPQMQSSELL